MEKLRDFDASIAQMSITKKACVVLCVYRRQCID